MSADEAHTIPDHVAARASRLINEAEDMRQQAADDLKQIYSDLREELRGMGWVGSVVSAEVAALKGAVSEMRLDDEKKAKREEKGERVGDYISMLSRARARDCQSYAEAKGVKITPSSGDVFADLGVERPADLPPRGFIASLPDEQKAAALAYRGDDTHGFEPTQEQPETANEVPAQDSGGNELGESHLGKSKAARPASVDAHVNDGGLAGEVSNEVVTAGETATHSHSVRTSSLASDNAGEVAPPASPAPIPDSDVPAFLRKDVPVDVTSPEFIKLLRPFCQNLDDCHGHGRECSKCKAVRAA